jgi:hypothetical protein
MSEAIAHPFIDTEPSESSQARQAAEAAFKPRPQQNNGGPVVVVKRRRPVENATGHLAQSEELAQPDDEARVPRVFRVEEVAAVPSERRDAPSPPLEKRDPPGDGSGNDGSASLPASPTRRRRRSIHGKVTIIRPDRSDRGLDARQAPDESTEPGHVGRTLVFVDADVSARYEAVTAEIEKLKRQAVALKKAEAAKAVRWIRRAISDYGLTERDLGL